VRLGWRQWTSWGVLCGSLLLAGCGPNYVVIKQADPNPLYQAKSLAILPIDFSKIAEVEPDHVKAINEGFATELTEEASFLKFSQAGGDALQIQGIVTMLEKGISAGVTSSDSELHLTVQIKKGSDVVDEVEFRAAVDQDDGFTVGGVGMSGFSDTQRLENCAEEIASDLADYLKKRVSTQ